jgi:hypothetical protein
LWLKRVALSGVYTAAPPKAQESFSMPRNNQNNRGGNNRSRSRNNNPEGRNQYSGFMSMARERPAMAAATAAGAVAAGVFLWSKRTQISDQLTQLSDQIGDWADSNNQGLEMAGGESDFTEMSGKSGNGRRGGGSGVTTGGGV